MAVALIVLRAIRIARPEHQHERLVACLEHWQHHLGGDVGEIFLLHDISHQCARLCEVARIGIVARRVLARGCNQRQAGCFQCVLHRLRQRNALLAAGRIVDDDCCLACALGVIEHQGRAKFADSRGAKALVACDEKD